MVAGGLVGSAGVGNERRSASRALRVSVVVPAKDEAANLPHVLGALPDGLHEVILVDGRSEDDTVAVARSVLPSITVVGQCGRGKGDALAVGFAAATGDVIVALDADGSTDPEEISSLVAALLGGADYVKGSRYLAGGGSEDLTLVRSLGNRALALTVNVLFGTRYTDLCYGYFGFWRRHLGALGLDCDGFEVETLLNIRAARAGLRIAEVPSFERTRIHGESSLHVVRDGLRILRTIVRERLAAGSGAVANRRGELSAAAGAWTRRGGRVGTMRL